MSRSPSSSRKFYDPDEVMTLHQMVACITDDIDSLSDNDFNKLYDAILDQAHLRRSFRGIERVTVESEWDF